MDGGLTFHLRKRTVAVFLLIAAALAAVLPLRSKSDELTVYMKAAERILHHEQIYRPDDSPAFTYPPFFVLPNVPLAPLNLWARASAWWFINLCLLGAIVYMIATMIWPTVVGSEKRDVRRRWALVLLVAVLSARFVLSPLEYQSHDLIVLALVMLTGLAISRGKDAAAGVYAGLAAACKATPLLFLPLFCWQRRFRAVACLLVALVAATLLPDLLFRAPEGRLWVVHWYDKFISKVHVDAPPAAAGAWSSWNMLNQGLSATIYRLSTPVETGGDKVNICVFPLEDTARKCLTFALELLIVAWLAWCTWPRRKRVAGLEPGLAALTQVGMVACGMLLLSPMSSSQHFCALLPPITACATYWLFIRRDRFVAAVLLLAFLFGTLAARDLYRPYADWLQAIGCKTWIAAALFLACGRILRANDP